MPTGDEMLNDGEILRCCGLSKTFGRRVVLAGLDLTIQRGEVFLLAGANGAGKTTLLSILCGLLKPSRGHVEWNNERGGSPKMHVSGFVGEPAFYPGYTAYQNLSMHAWAHRTRLPKSEVDRLCRKLSFDPEFLTMKVGALSTGTLKRLAILRSVLYHPSLVLLDEPMNGLDPQGVVEMRSTIRSLNEQESVTVILSSHFLSEAAQISDRAGVLRDGHIVAERTIGFTASSVTVRTHGEKLEALISALSDEGLSWNEVDGSAVIIDVPEEERAALLRRLVVRYELEILAFAPSALDLEGWYLSAQRSDRRDA